MWYRVEYISCIQKKKKKKKKNFKGDSGHDLNNILKAAYIAQQCLVWILFFKSIMMRMEQIDYFLLFTSMPNPCLGEGCPRNLFSCFNTSDFVLKVQLLLAKSIQNT